MPDETPIKDALLPVHPMHGNDPIRIAEQRKARAEKFAGRCLIPILKGNVRHVAFATDQMTNETLMHIVIATAPTMYDSAALQDAPNTNMPVMLFESLS